MKGLIYSFWTFLVTFGHFFFLLKYRVDLKTFEEKLFYEIYSKVLLYILYSQFSTTFLDFSIFKTLFYGFWPFLDISYQRYFIKLFHHIHWDVLLWPKKAHFFLEKTNKMAHCALLKNFSFFYWPIMHSSCSIKCKKLCLTPSKTHKKLSWDLCDNIQSFSAFPKGKYTDKKESNLRPRTKTWAQTH